MSEYFSPNLKKVDKKGQLNHRMLYKKLDGFNKEIFTKCSSILWIEEENVILLGNNDCFIYVYILNQALELVPKLALTPFTKPIKNMRYCSRTKHVITISNDNVLAIWNKNVKNPLSSFSCFKDLHFMIRNVFAPDKNNIVVGTSDDGHVVVWDLLNFSRVCTRTFGPKSNLV